MNVSTLRPREWRKGLKIYFIVLRGVLTGARPCCRFRPSGAFPFSSPLGAVGGAGDKPLPHIDERDQFVGRGFIPRPQRIVVPGKAGGV